MEMSKYKQVLEGLYSTIEAKNHDYGDSFERTIDEFGVTAAAIRLNDKVERLKTLVKGSNAKVDESIMDTLRDIAGYSTLALTCLDGKTAAKDYIAKHLKDSLYSFSDEKRPCVNLSMVLVNAPVNVRAAINGAIESEVKNGAWPLSVDREQSTADSATKLDIKFTTDSKYPEVLFTIECQYYKCPADGSTHFIIIKKTKDIHRIICEG